MVLPDFPLPSGTGLKTVAIDFDGTLAEGTWPSPELGAPIQLGVDAACFYYGKGFEVVIYTARPLTHREAIFAWCRDHGLGGVVYDVICDKPRAALYIDDRAISFPGGLLSGS